MPNLSTSSAREAAVDAVVAGMYASTTRVVQDAKWSTISKVLGKFGYTPLPLTPDKVLALGGALKAGGYRSASAYLSLYRTVAVRAGDVVTDQTARLFKDITRSCARGLGGPVRARALPLEHLGSLPGEAKPWAVGGPLGPRNALVAGAFWLLREAELSSARAGLVEISLAPSGRYQARWHLPASKTDQLAIGVARTHGCACSPGRPPSPACPVHALWSQMLLLQRAFPQRWRDAKPDWDLPLFPDAAGNPCSKQAVVATILTAADHLGIARASPDNTERVSGHSLRATGAQGLARAGLDVWRIQLLGRWGSDAVLGYIREAHLESSAEWARQALETLTLKQVTAHLAPVVAQAP